MRVLTCECICMFLCLYACMHLCMCVCTYIQMYACIYAWSARAWACNDACVQGARGHAVWPLPRTLVCSRSGLGGEQQIQPRMVWLHSDARRPESEGAGGWVWYGGCRKRKTGRFAEEEVMITHEYLEPRLNRAVGSEIWISHPKAGQGFDHTVKMTVRR